MFGKFLNAPFTKWSEIHFHQAFFQLSIGTNWARLYILTLVIPKSFGNLKMLYAYILYVASLFNFDCNCQFATGDYSIGLKLKKKPLILPVSVDFEEKWKLILNEAEKKLEELLVENYSFY